MQLRSDIQISTMITAMTDVILPAVDPANRLAVEQSHLVVGMLHLMARQLPLQFAFDCDELARLVKTTSEILTSFPQADIPGALALSHARAAALLEDAKVGPADLWLAIRALRENLGILITAFQTRDATQLAVLETMILKMSDAQLLRDRALLKSQNWETNPDDVPDIETLLEGP